MSSTSVMPDGALHENIYRKNTEVCPFCSGELDQKDLVDEGRWYVWISKDKLVVDMYEGDYVNSLKIPMHYCLNCGRKLEE